MTNPGPSARPQAFFEEYRGRTTARQMPLQPLDPAAAFEAFGIRNTAFARLLAAAAFRASGFARFHRRLPDRLDNLVEGSYRVAATGPVVAATMALVDAPSAPGPFLRAAAMIKACWDINRELRDGTFAPDEHRGEPLEMRQYLNLFGTMSVFDGKEFRLFKTADERRLLVLARGRPFVVDLGAGSAEPSVSSMAEALERAWNQSDHAQPGGEDGGFGWVSCLPLTQQQEQLANVLADPSSARSYDLLRSTFLTLCLDIESKPADFAEEARAAHSGNCGNRWFHASVQLVVFGNAKASVICDFNAGLGGNTMMRAAAEIHRRSLPFLGSHVQAPSPAEVRVESLAWTLDRAIAQGNAAAMGPLLDTQQATFELRGRGREAFAARGLDPVPVFSTAVQHAVFRLTGRFVRVRQFVSQAKYRAHNVALALVSTREMRALIDALAVPGPDRDVVGTLFRAAVDAQRQQNRNARSYVSVARALQLFRSVQSDKRAPRVLGVMFSALRALKLQKPVPPTDVVLSHPDLFPDVPIMGRPGIRLPYVGCFGLHYLIWDDRITVTVMPSTAWTIPNTQLIAEIESCLDRLAAIGTSPELEAQSTTATSRLIPRDQTGEGEKGEF